MPIRGLRALLQRTAPSKLVRSRKGTGYRLKGPGGKGTGPRLRGVAKRLSETVWVGADAGSASGSNDRRGRAWRGVGGGLRRGSAVDAECSRLCRVSADKRRKSKMLKLTRTVFAALEHHKLEPVDAQRCVADAKRRLGTACDIVAQRGNDELVVVELKCGYPGTTKKRALAGAMKAPLQRARDTHLHRHFAQLAATLALFEAETGTQRALEAKGIARVSAALLYADDNETTLFELPAWWRRRGDALLAEITRARAARK